MPTEEQLQEIHRLAVLGDVAAIAQEVGPWLTGHWLATSRFREVRELSLQTLALGPHARTLVHLARAKRIRKRNKFRCCFILLDHSLQG